MDPIEALRIRGIGVGKKLVGDAQAGDVRSGKTFSNADGNDKSGTLPVRSLVAQTVTPGVNNITKQAGIYDGDITIEGDPDLVAANIISGKSIFGIAGNFAGKRTANGTATSASNNLVTVRGLTFQPKIIILKNPSVGLNFEHYLYNGYYSTTNWLFINNAGSAGSRTFSPESTLYSDGFSCYVALSNISHQWWAFE